MRIGSEFIVCVMVAIVVMAFAPNYGSAEEVKEPDGQMYYKGDGAPQDYKKAFEAYSREAEKGSLIAQSMLGAMYYTGKGVPKDDKKAFEAYKIAAEEGYDVAQYRLGYAYEYGIGTARDPERSLEWTRKAAEQGNSDARYLLLGVYKSASSLPKSFYDSILIDVSPQ